MRRNFENNTFLGGLSSIVVAGPSSSLTIPGIIVSQIVSSLCENNSVIRIDVDATSDFDAGLHRSRSLAAAHHSALTNPIVNHRAPYNARLRAQSFYEWIKPGSRAAIAIVWPGLDHSWIRQFLAAAKSAGVTSMVMVVSLPRPDASKLVAIADSMFKADAVLVGTANEAEALTRVFGTHGPKVEVHKALSLHGQEERSSVHRITAFLQKDSHETLATLLRAFDAIPEAWIESYKLDVVMRYRGDLAEKMVEESYHSDFVSLNGMDIASTDLNRLCASSSALIIADPAFDSRAFSIAVECGVAVVVLASTLLPEVGRGYVGALLADMSRPVSVRVALSHALRLADLHFPPPDSWNDLVNQLVGTTPLRAVPPLPLVPSRRIV
ncbi:MAG: hypothetical protein ABSA07_08430 [Acidimicrobiales bacterium]